MNTKETFKRFMIHQDDEDLQAIVSDLKYFMPKLQDLKKAYEALELENEPFTSSVFLFIKESGVNQIADLFIKQLNDGLDKTGVINEKLRTIVLSGTEIQISNLHQAYSELKKVVPPAPKSLSYFKPDRTALLTLNDIDFEDGAFVVNEHSRELLAEKYFRIYIENEQQNNIYNNLMTMKQAFIDYENWIKSLGLPRSVNGGNFTDRLEDFFTFDRETRKLELIPSSIKWAQGYKGYAKMMNEKYSSSRL